MVAGEVRNLAQRLAAAAKKRVDLDPEKGVKMGSSWWNRPHHHDEVVAWKRVTDIMAEITVASVEKLRHRPVNRAVTRWTR